MHGSHWILGWQGPGGGTQLPKGEMGVVTIMASRLRAALTSLTCADYHWLVDHGVPTSKIEWEATKFLLDLYK